MSYTKKQFLNDVKKEADALKSAASPSELSNLNFNSLDPDNMFKCIYGQMTGDCTNKRAANLIEKCCPRFFVNTHKSKDYEAGFTSVKKTVNGEKVDRFIEERTNCEIRHFSAIETYILMPDSKRENLINYLQGKSKKLVL